MTLSGNTELGDHCRIHSYAAIGDVPQDRSFHDEESSCIVGAGTVVREGCTIHRGTGAGTQTVIGQRCYLMTNSHVGHNCIVGDDVTLVSGALLGGYVSVGDGAVIAGNAGIHQFVRIGSLAIVSCVSCIVQDVPPFAMTDRRGRIAGINLTGLKRAGFKPDDRTAIREAFRVIYRSTQSPTAIADELAREFCGTAVQPLITFLRAPSRRGLCRASRGFQTSP